MMHKAVLLDTSFFLRFLNVDSPSSVMQMVTFDIFFSKKSTCSFQQFLLQSTVLAEILTSYH